jgi:DNA topoisomerase IA
MKTLLIVESPAKSKTIEKLLGKDYIVMQLEKINILILSL